MYNIHLVNISGTNIVFGSVVIPPGATIIPSSLEFVTQWNAAAPVLLTTETHATVVLNGSTTILEEGSNRVDDIGVFMAGFGLIFAIGLYSLGARWVRKSVVEEL